MTGAAEIDVANLTSRHASDNKIDDAESAESDAFEAEVPTN